MVFAKSTGWKSRFYITEMQRDGLKLKKYMYGALITGACNAGEMSVAGEIFKEMLGKGVMTDSAIYTAMINGYHRGGKVAEAVAVCVRMIKQGDHQESNIKSVLEETDTRSIETEHDSPQCLEEGSLFVGEGGFG
ncbi:hypothetical protein MLD38_039943 [Melastoma candidum]|uniref:Uncharacterized protein n=1 Tax=Melastoma candidum TaxID=119954 RepID=A0ACB9L5A2_9MYRT|nr:hypothetical protein MLD38_039943 [Melastoma candidum]